MNDETLRIVVGVVILVHGIAHIGAIGALLWIRSGHETGSGSWTAARTWLAPRLSQQSATYVAMGLYAVSLVGFVLTALAFWGILPVAWWAPLGIVSAIVSTTSILLFFGTWPAFNMLAALAVNVGIVLAVVLGWPPASVLGG